MEATDVEELQEALDRARLEIAELRESRARLVLGADAERRRIEGELHDGVQQHLVALAMRVQLAREAALENDPPAMTAFLEEIGRDVQEAIDEASALAERIHPPRLDAGNLQMALRSRALAGGVRATIDVGLSTATAPETVGAVYFCCLTALEGVRPGARVAIALRDDEGGVAFHISVDGVDSIDSARFGALRDRVEALGGDVVVESEPRGKTRVAGTIPL